jgi:tripartite-type tricarboxylate transporter receptor subunit TctC
MIKNPAARLRCLAAGALLAVATTAAAQTFPGKPVRIISPYPPGGTTDLLSRMLAPKITESWGQQVIVENRPGGNTVIGTEALVRSAPDGYTLICILSSHVIVPNLTKTPYDVLKDFTAVATIGATQLVVVVHPSVPARNVQELIALAKRRDGQLNYGSGGSGTVTHLAGEYFNMLAGVKIQHIPYKGSSQALTDLIGGQIHMYYSPPIVAIPHVKTGRLRALGLTGDTLIDALPQVPLVSAAGLKGFELKIWYGLLGPAGMPKPVVDRINAEVNRVLALPDIRDQLLASGMNPFPSAPDRFDALIKADFDKYRNIIKSANITLK